ncbi:MAG: hypothetical protein J6I73_10040 [Treponema sp.]|nr:hypothetical protein [Treponema sp.]
MNRKYICLVCIFLSFCISCNSKELKGFGNPKIGKIVQIARVTILSEYNGDLIYPKYKIELTVKEKYNIVSLHLRTNYIFGQDLNFISSKNINLNTNELDILNKERKYSLIIELEPIQKEVIRHEFSIGKLNEERISNAFIYIKYK